MQAYTFYREIEGKRVEYVRVSKVKAQRAFEAGTPFVMVACKMVPFGGWTMGCDVDPKREAFEGEEFDTLYHSFRYYNCTSETGYYPSYYMQATLV